MTSIEQILQLALGSTVYGWSFFFNILDAVISYTLLVFVWMAARYFRTGIFSRFFLFMKGAFLTAVVANFLLLLSGAIAFSLPYAEPVIQMVALPLRTSLFALVLFAFVSLLYDWKRVSLEAPIQRKV